MPGDPADPTADLRRLVQAALDAAWVEDVGYTAPNTEVYPWLWLWDSCFHSLIWTALDRPDRAAAELTAALTPDATGFVPHMGYALDPERPVELWGRRGGSSITQPPMYGHTFAQLRRAGVVLPEGTADSVAAGLRFLFEKRSRTDGLIEVVHPWETGCDDSPRWDDLSPGDHFDVDDWRTHKMTLLPGIERGPKGEPLHNPDFAVGSVGFNALAAFNAREYAAVTGDYTMVEATTELVDAIDARFDPHLRTWVDTGPTASGSGRARTVDALLPMLVTHDPTARRLVTEELLDEDAYASAYGPRGVHVGEPTFARDRYWRGPVWPQLAYLLWLALASERGRDAGGADRRDETDAAEVIRTTTIAGAIESGLAEYWDGDSGRGFGAVPQSWTGLALVLAQAGPAGPVGA